MFANLSLLPDDPILKLSRLFAEDARADKLDVGIGIYQNERGETPVMRAVKAAEQRVWETQSSKKYLGLAGNEAFNQAIAALVLGDDVDAARVRVNQTIAGTGALRLVGETLHSIKPDAQVWIPDQTWGNHVPIFAGAGYAVKTYPYYDLDTAKLTREAFFEAMRSMGPNDIVLLHGCCHNPSGEDLTPQEWQTLADIAVERGFLPIIDLAYVGFGDGIEEDTFGVRCLAQHVENLFICVSCSKNFGLYRDRTGAAISIGANAKVADALQSHISTTSRAMISVPADHGAAVVASILDDSGLRDMWADELAGMRQNIQRRRVELANALCDATGEDWSAITGHKGMFSLLPLGAERVVRLREEYGIYMVGTGRINIAGLHSEADSEALAKAIHGVLRT